MNTKVFLFLAGIFFISLQTLNAQRGLRVGYIDMDYILENVPDYQEASKQLAEKVSRWKADIESKLNDVNEMKKQLENERPLLTQELIEERIEEITFEENQISDYQQKLFGPGGSLATQKRQLVEPVQDQVFNAVQEISTAKKYDYVMNKSEVLMLYAADRHDLSDQVLRNITRSSKRKQINNRKEENAFDKEESEVSEAALKRQKEIEEKKSERESALAEKTAAREALKEERQKAFEEKRKKLLEERQRKKDSIAALKLEKTTAKSTKDAVTDEGGEVNAEEARAAIIEARKQRKDSILNARKARRDSILEARKNNKKPIQEKIEGEGK